MAIVIVLVAVAAGAWAAIRWLPPLAPGRDGEVVFWLVCGMIATAAATLAFGGYMALRVLDDGDLGNGLDSAASVVLNALRDAGILLGIAAGVYLLAGPRASDDGAEHRT